MSTDSLIITAEEVNSSNEVILKPFARKIGAKRFLFDNNVFLKDIKTKQGFKKKVSFFKQSLSLKKLPDNWKQYLDSISLKINALDEISKVKVYRIPEDNLPLRELIVKDPILKDLVLKAEDFHILLLAPNLSKFKKRMQDLGYLLT